MRQSQNQIPRTSDDQKKARSFAPEHWQIIAFLLAVYDVLAVNGAYLLALWLRFDCQVSEIPHEYLMSWLQFVPFYAAACLLVFHFCQLYRSLWQFASYNELIHIFLASIITGLFTGLCAQFLLERGNDFWKTILK